MKCPKCKKEIDEVNVISECWQKAEIDKGKVFNYGSIEEILETKKVECPECYEDISNYVEEEQ